MEIQPTTPTPSTTPTSSPWLQMSADLTQQLQQQPPEVQQAIKAISKPVYPGQSDR